jgi:hypothetical protein
VNQGFAECTKHLFDHLHCFVGTTIEVKGKANITRKDFKGLTAIKEEELIENYILVTLEDTPRKDGDICILPWKDFITNLWQDAYV